MNAEEMRIAIAKKCGWTIGTEGYGWPGESIGEFRPLPNYPADLNAMHEAEKALAGPRDDPESEVSRWKEQLMLVCGDKKDPWNCYDVDLFMATALQRAEAFCRVFWPERFKE